MDEFRPTSEFTAGLLRLAVGIVDTHLTRGARRNAWRAMQADAQRVRDRAEAERLLSARARVRSGPPQASVRSADHA